MTMRWATKPGRLNIVVSGGIAGTPNQAGIAWVMLQYVLGLQRLGHGVFFIDPIQPEALSPPGTALADTANAAAFDRLVTEFGLVDASALVVTDGSRATIGQSYEDVKAVIGQSDILLDISGKLRDAELLAAATRAVYLDIDPAFTQLWQYAQGIDMGFEGHTDFVTVGLNIGQADCTVPTLGLDWHTTLQPVVLERWPMSPPRPAGPLTTIANWRGYGSIEHAGIFYGQKVHALRELMTLPTLTAEVFELALVIDPAEVKDLALLQANRWRIVDPAVVAGTASAYQAFIRESKAEFGFAKTGYVASRCGWFSDRSICYLASGRPVIAQETGFSRVIPSGRGLLAFSTIPDVLDAIASLNGNYDDHARGARALAEEFFDSDRVLGRLLSGLGA
jgi:hypothetical protein